jgi:predicted metal-binding membrane protein
MPAHAHTAPGLDVWPLALMWFAMMAAMMAPTAWPWVRAYHRFTGTDRRVQAGDTARFASGYLVAWSGYALAAAVLQAVLQSTALMPATSDIVLPRVGAMIFLAAGLYQFAPLKRACLTHCRTPFGYFLTRWRSGPAGAFRMGLHHGLFCVGCCWALMLTAFAVGVMNAWWMAALASLALVEQTAPHGHLLRRAIGALLLIAGAARL